MNLKEMLLTAPDTQLSKKTHKYMEKWSNPPTALQLLEILDYSARYSYASDFVMRILDTAFEEALTEEGLTREQVVALAYWRNEPDD
jgi:hypothetical protein